MKLLVIVATLLGSFAAYADASPPAETVTIERSRAEVPLTIDLNGTTVKCLLGDYGSESLKISLPDLRDYTVFRQTTRGETAPCINAGSCLFDTTPDGRKLDPSLIIDPARPTEDVKILVVLNEILIIDHAQRSCSRSLVENISSTVRGLDFRHSDGAYLGTLDYDLCLKMKP